MQTVRNLAIGLCGVGFVIIGLFPPWIVNMKDHIENKGYAFITTPPSTRGQMLWFGDTEVDFSRLIVEWIIWGFICGAIWLLTKKREKEMQ